MRNPRTGELRVRATVPERDVDVALDIAPGETVALLGPNGAGKSTILDVIAGLVTSTGPSVALDGRRLDGIAPHNRGVALLAQDPLLFPHLSALENVAFGPRAAGAGRREARARAREHLDAVGVADLANRRPRSLSGGQQQRVAIARALAAEPNVLLLDEPMAALDVDVTPALRRTLRGVLATRTAVIVTHDLLDAVMLADRVVVVENGRVVEAGPTAKVLTVPRSSFAARLAGLDLLTGQWDGDALVTPAGHRIHGSPDDLTAGDAASALFRPSSVAIFAEPPGGSPRNALSVTVTDLEPVGDLIRVRATLTPDEPPLAADLTPAAVADLGLDPGAHVTFSIKATEVSIYGTFKPEIG